MTNASRISDQRLNFLPRLGRQFADGADVLDYLTEIPLPGRTLAAPLVGVVGRTADVALPTFVAGPENRLVAATINRLLASASALADSPCNSAPRRFAPAVLALFGSSGTGKTHLARGLVRYWQERHGAESADYVTASDFRRRFAEAIDGNAVADFRRQLRARQLLAIDDLHRLPSDDYLLQELRYTFDAYEETGATVVATSIRPVGARSNMPPDLRSRLATGLVLQLAPPGSAARIRLVRQASTALGRPLSDAVANQLAAGLRGTANELFGALFELCATSPAGRVSDTDRAERLLAARAARRPTLRQIVAVVAKYHALPQKQLKSSSRKQAAVFARATVIYLARDLAAASYEQIGRALGGRDHTTIMHSYQKIERERHRDLATQEALDDLRRILVSS